jgi:hypothetical protein
MSNYLNDPNHLWLPNRNTLLDFCVTISPRPASRPGMTRLKVMFHHVPERQKDGRNLCLRCGKFLDDVDRQLEARELAKNIKEV